MADEFLPDPSAVAAILRARTYVADGQLEGEWSDETRPTKEQVEDLIPRAYSEVSARIGQDIDESSRYFKWAATIVAIRTAMWVELSYFPEQADEDRETVYKELKDLFEEELGRLIAALPDTSS